MTLPSSASSNRAPNNRAIALAQLLAEHIDAHRQPSRRHPTEDELQTYVDAQLQGATYQADYATIAHHLDACIVCAETYARLYELTLAEKQETLVTAQQHPEVDLAFLQPTTPVDRLSQLRDAIAHVGQRLTLQLRADLLPGLRPVPAGATLRTSAGDDRYSEQILTLEDRTLPLAIAAYRDAQQPTFCLLEITLTPPDRSWPDLAAIPVTLQLSTEQRSTMTDAWGLAVFTDVPIDQLAELRVEATL